MAVYHRCPQYSDEWERLRLGLPTASNFSEIITPTGKPAKSETMRKYAHTLIAERILGRRMDAYMSPAMETGKMLEGDALAYYEVQKQVTVDPMGFITTDDRSAGCSPDGLIGEDGILEIKCPQPHTHIGYLLGAPLDEKYKFQTQGQLYVSGRKWSDIISYHPEMTLLPKIVRQERDEEYISLIQNALGEFNNYINECLIKVGVLLKTKEEER